MHKFEKHIEITAPQASVIQAIEAECALSHQQIKNAINKGALWLTRGKGTQRLRRVKKPLTNGDTLHFYYNEAVLSQTPLQAELIKDCHDYSVWYKPYGMLSQGSKWSDHCTIARWAEIHLLPQRPAFIVHRLDRAATGLIVIAHSKSAVKALTKLFETRSLKKTYQIIGLGELEPSQTTTITEPVDGKPATSHFKSLAYDKKKDLSLIEVHIESGRKHQIRKHSAFINHPVFGDRLYNTKQNNDEFSDNLQLCAAKLSFQCPITNTLSNFETPAHLLPSIKKLKF
ncbi:MAG: RluA family pseudouridine synthase [Thalassotalea sp.]